MVAKVQKHPFRDLENSKTAIVSGAPSIGTKRVDQVKFVEDSL